MYERKNKWMHFASNFQPHIVCNGMFLNRFYSSLIVIANCFYFQIEFPPDICSRVTFVNFTVTRGSLQSQCLNQVLKAERPDVDEKRSDLLKLQGIGMNTENPITQWQTKFWLFKTSIFVNILMIFVIIVKVLPGFC